MRQSVWTFALFLVCLSALCNFTQGRIISKRQAGDEIDPTKQEADADDDSSRDKRKVDVKYGVKNAILGFVFNNQNQKPQATGFSWERKPPTTTTPKGPTTTEDIVIFEKGERVSIEIPDQFFGSAFKAVTDVSSTVGNLMINSAFRLQRLLESMRPLLRTVFGAKGFVIEATNNDKPIFSDGNSV